MKYKLCRHALKVSLSTILCIVFIHPTPSWAVLIVNYGDTVTISNGDTVVQDYEVIGDQSDGTLNQTGGTNTVDGMVSVGHSIPSTGTYNLSGGELSANNEYLGFAGNGTFTQSGGTNTVNSGVTLGYYGTGVYNLISGGLSAGYLWIGLDGTGTLNQSGGTNTLSGAVGDQVISLGVNAGATGTYTLSGTGELTAAQINVGYDGTGDFIQSSGSNTSGSLVIGRNIWSSGRYEMTGGTLLTNNTVIGLSSDNQGLSYYTTHGTFEQSGGEHIVTGYLEMGDDGGTRSTYNLSGGSLSAYKEIIGKKSWGLYDNDGRIEAGSEFTQTGGTNTVDTQLVIGEQYGSSGSYTLVDGSLAAANVILGASGDGIFNQTGGTNNITYDLVLGFEDTPYFGGTYNLSGGNLSASYEHIGYKSDGVFTQTDGVNTVSHTLYVGGTSNGNGTYELNGGTLNATAVVAGNGSAGTFNQSAGSSTVSSLTVGSSASSVGNYNLSGGQLNTTGDVFIARFDGSTGTFTQTGGVHKVTGTLHVSTDTSQGTYHLNGGSLTANVIDVNSTTGGVTFDGGTLSVGTFNGDLVNAGGKLAPGESPGLSVINGNYTQNPLGVLSIELGDLGIMGDYVGGTDYDLLQILGNANLAGTLEILLFDDFVPLAGSSFTFLTANHIEGMFDYLVLPTVSGVMFDLAYTSESVSLNVASVAQAVPEPSTLVLIVLGLIATSIRRINAITHVY